MLRQVAIVLALCLLLPGQAAAQFFPPRVFSDRPDLLIQINTNPFARNETSERDLLGVDWVPTGFSRKLTPRKSCTTPFVPQEPTMDKPISFMMAKTVWTVDTEDTIESVDSLLTSRDLSAVPVVDKKGVVFGILSSLDLLHFHATKKNPKAVRAWELCTYKPVAVSPETSVAEVARLMIKNKIHHVLITKDGTLLGIVSALNFVEQYVLKGGT